MASNNNNNNNNNIKRCNSSSSSSSATKEQVTETVRAAAAAIICSIFACVLFAISAATSPWHSVIFDFAKVNATASASGAYAAVLQLTAADGAVAGVVLLTQNSTGYCLLNVQSGLWFMCDSVLATDTGNQAYHTYCPKFDIVIRNYTCFSYVAGYARVREQMETTAYSSESQLMKMQNNIVSCCIVVLLCMLASLVTGMIGIIGRLVPAVMVTGVQLLTAGIFVIFGNSIAHEKVSRMTRRPQIVNCPQCVCNSMMKVPELFCEGEYRTVSIGWSLILSWVSAAVFIVASLLWLLFTRRLRLQKSKTMM